MERATGFGLLTDTVTVAYRVPVDTSVKNVPNSEVSYHNLHESPMLKAVRTRLVQKSPGNPASSQLARGAVHDAMHRHVESSRPLEYPGLAELGS